MDLKPGKGFFEVTLITPSVHMHFHAFSKYLSGNHCVGGFYMRHHQEALWKREMQLGEQASIKWGLTEGCCDPAVEWLVMKVFKNQCIAMASG